jgi:hypothetical protein
MAGEMVEWYERLRMGSTWGTLVLEYEEKDRALESAEQRAAREKKTAAEEAERLLEEEVIRREVYARDVKIRTHIGLKRNETVAKRQQPCKWVVGEFLGDECWAHEYTDPKTRNRVIKHTCDRLHPGEEGWCKEWLTNPRWKPAAPAPAVRNFSGLSAKRPKF